MDDLLSIALESLHSRIRHLQDFHLTQNQVGHLNRIWDNINILESLFYQSQDSDPNHPSSPRIIDLLNENVNELLNDLVLEVEDGRPQRQRTLSSSSCASDASTLIQDQ